MSKELYLIGNLKMNMNKETITAHLKQIKKLAKGVDNHVGICVPYVYLPLAQKILGKSNVLYGAQNMHELDNGTFTGEISAEMLNDFGCDMVIIGHSERRANYNETDQSVNLKVLKALSANLVPILCFGESWEEREAGKTIDVIERQLTEALKGVKIEDLTSIIFAYEPIWAISAGKDAKPRNATSDQAEEAISKIKEIICGIFGLKSSDMIVVLYGGSMNDKNCAELLAKPSIDGGLIGGACLTIEKFSKVFTTQI